MIFYLFLPTNFGSFCSCPLAPKIRLVFTVFFCLNYGRYFRQTTNHEENFHDIIFTVRNSSCRKVMFLQASVKNSGTGGVGRDVCPTAVHSGIHNPSGRSPAHTPLGRQTPRHPPGQTPPGQTPPWSDTSPGQTPALAGRHPLLPPPP